jgi:hypothetical protein
MIRDYSHDTSADSLKRLMPLTPDPDRSERVRVRCRMQLERNGRNRARTAVIRGFTSRVLAPAVIGGFCLLYVVALVATTLRLEGVLH